MKPAGKYTVLVNDNFHYMDESERYELGSFETLDEVTCPVCRTSSYVRAPNKFSFLGQVGHWIVSGTGGR